MMIISCDNSLKSNNSLAMIYRELVANDFKENSNRKKKYNVPKKWAVFTKLICNQLQIIFEWMYECLFNCY